MNHISRYIGLFEVVKGENNDEKTGNQKQIFSKIMNVLDKHLARGKADVAPIKLNIVFY